MKKIIHPCDVPMWDGKKWPMFCRIEYTDGKLSISGVIGPNHYGNAKGGCGQIDMEFDHEDKSQNDSRYDDPIKASSLRFAPGWNRAKWYKFLDAWHKWHLNDMKAGCEHQRAMEWETEPIDPDKPIGWHIDLKNANLKSWEHPPVGHLTEPCPVCGYKYGTSWLKVDVPADVIEFIMSLPDTDRQPAWV